MGSVPDTKKSDLEKMADKLKAEVEIWESLGMSLDATIHPNSSIYAMKMQLQTIVNVLLEKSMVPLEEFDLEFKRLVLEDMEKIREEHEPTIREQRRDFIVGGAKPPIVVPNFKLLGPDGKEVKL